MELLGSRGKKAERDQKDVKDWTSSHNKSRRIETVLARLRLGHTNITHVYLMQSQTEPSECDRCRVTITVKHLLCSDRILTFGIRSIRSPAKVGLVVTELLITSPVVSWRGVGDPPTPPAPRLNCPSLLNHEWVNNLSLCVDCLR